MSAVVTVLPTTLLFPHLLAGAITGVAALLLAGLAYVFQPAWAAHRARRLDAQQGRAYTFPVYSSGGKGNGKKGQEGEQGEAPFPTVEDPPTVLLSLVVPAYNEEQRLPVMLDETLAFLEAWKARMRCVVVRSPSSCGGAVVGVLGWAFRGRGRRKTQMRIRRQSTRLTLTS